MKDKKNEVWPGFSVHKQGDKLYGGLPEFEGEVKQGPVPMKFMSANLTQPVPPNNLNLFQALINCEADAVYRANFFADGDKCTKCGCIPCECEPVNNGAAKPHKHESINKNEAAPTTPYDIMYTDIGNRGGNQHLELVTIDVDPDTEMPRVDSLRLNGKEVAKVTYMDGTDSDFESSITDLEIIDYPHFYDFLGLLMFSGMPNTKTIFESASKKNEGFDTYAVAWKEFDRQDRIVSKQKEFKTATARDSFIKKIQEHPRFYEIVATSDPENESSKKTEANMSYCRFYNTLLDLHDCYRALADEEIESDEEAEKAKQLIQLCKDIVEEFDEDFVDQVRANDKAFEG